MVVFAFASPVKILLLRFTASIRLIQRFGGGTGATSYIGSIVPIASHHLSVQVTVNTM